MTILVGVATPEGLVLASDSRATSHFDSGHHRIASDNAQKVFKIGRMGVATFGLGFLGEDSIAGVMDQFAARVSEQELAFDAFAIALEKFFDDRFQAALAAEGLEWDVDKDGWPLGFLVAGYDSDGIGYISQVVIPAGGDPETISADTVGLGSMWRGQTDVIRRLIKGIDLRLLLAGEEDQSNIDPDGVGHLEYLVIDPITIQDGIDFAAFLVRTTIDMQRFSDGTLGAPGAIPGCGGPMQILAIERSGPTWVSKLSLQGPSEAGRAEGAAGG